MLRTLKYTVTIIGLLILVGLSFGSGFGLARFTTAAPLAPRIESPDYFKVFWEAWGITQQNFVDPKALDPLRMTRGAIKGMLDSLGDPHTGYVDPQLYKFEQADLEGAFDGIGAQVGIQNRRLTVIAPMEGSPAEKAGIRPGDLILQIDGKDTTGMSVAEAVSKIRGQRGTKVKLSLLHEGDKRPTEVEIVRDQIKLPSTSRKILPGNIGYVRLAFFSEKVKDELKPVLESLVKGQVDGLVLDLRNNPGGLLDETISVASQFIKQGVVAYQVDKDGKKTEYPVRPGGIATDIPMVVLVNKGSASASEILAGAIQDAGRGVIIGEETFGKGSVNRFHELSDGSALYVTFARWLTPKGRLIEGKGLLPDIEVPQTEDDRQAGRDPQLDRALEYLKTGR
ncbi:MAG: S41 family peptidase [Dehalococcoidia bacterium]|nr:S41 family peptidase [Dehalococcoidia bacterium]